MGEEFATPTAARSSVQINETEGNLILGSFKAAKGEARFATEVERKGDDLILHGTDIEGDATLKEAIAAAKEYGQKKGAKRVIIEMAKRTSGSRPGHVPKPIIVETGH